MKIKVGTKYVTSDELKAKIITGSCKIQEESQTVLHECYLCRKRIADNNLVYAYDHLQAARFCGHDNYFLHKQCYQQLILDEQAFAA